MKGSKGRMKKYLVPAVACSKRKAPKGQWLDIPSHRRSAALEIHYTQYSSREQATSEKFLPQLAFEPRPEGIEAKPLDNTPT